MHNVRFSAQQNKSAFALSDSALREKIQRLQCQIQRSKKKFSVRKAGFSIHRNKSAHVKLDSAFKKLIQHSEKISAPTRTNSVNIEIFH